MKATRSDLRARQAEGSARIRPISEALPFGKLWYQDAEQQSGSLSFSADHNEPSCAWWTPPERSSRPKLGREISKRR